MQFNEETSKGSGLQLKELTQTLSSKGPSNLGITQIFGHVVHEVSVVGDEDEAKNGKFKVVELWIKDESFWPEFNAEVAPSVESILKQTSKMPGKVTQALAIATETYCQAGTGNGAKGVSRVVLVNEFGQRVLDAQLQLVNAAQVQGRAQNKFLREQAQQQAPSAEIVRKVILHLLKGRILVGYHLSPKLRELMILDEVQALAHSITAPGDPIPNPFDCASRFSGENKSQVPLQSLCHSHLKLQYRRSKNQPSAFTEAKVAMALFRTWKSSKGLDEETVNLQSLPTIQEELAVPIESQIRISKEGGKLIPKVKSLAPVEVKSKLSATATSQIEVMTGAQLKALIKALVTDSVNQKLSGMMEKLKE